LQPSLAVKTRRHQRKYRGTRRLEKRKSPSLVTGRECLRRERSIPCSGGLPSSSLDLANRFEPD
jgi:hypothetical protein